MDKQTGTWQQPQLIVLHRGEIEDPVLAGCRTAGAAAPKAGFGECVTPMCNGCGTGLSS